MGEDFAAAVHTLAESVLPLSNDDAREFLERHPLDAWFM
jgi:hypothetical protein